MIELVILVLFGCFGEFYNILNFAKLSQAKPQLQLSWLALASLNFT